METPVSPLPRKGDLNGLLTVKCVWPIFSKYVNPVLKTVKELSKKISSICYKNFQYYFFLV